jgi:uncharacterized protein
MTDSPAIPPPLIRPRSDRYVCIDLLRGVAVLGILLMNIQSFGLPMMAYFDRPSWTDGMTVDEAIQLAVTVLVSAKFISLFAILFGAGLVLQSERPGRTAIHYRRMGVLFGIGLIHGLVFWYGDVLTSYALIGMLAFLFRGLSIRWLIGIALSGVGLSIGAMAASGGLLHLLPDADFVEFQASLATDEMTWAEEIAAYRGGWLDQMSERGPAVAYVLGSSLLLYGPQLLGLMALGMAMVKSGFLTGGWSDRAYLLVAGAGVSIGVIVAMIELVWIVQTPGQYVVHQFFAMSLSLVSAPIQASGYAALILWVSRRWAPAAVVALGRCSLSGYLLSTLLCTTFFYGHGLGYFAYLSLSQLMLVVVGVWVILLVAARLWLGRFRTGPMEWLWRRLSYGGNS